MITIDWHPSPAHLRRWALMVAAGTGMSGALFQFLDWGVFRVGHGLGIWLWAFGLFALVTAGTGSRLGLVAYWAWMGFAWTVGTALGIAALAVVFFGVVTPLAIVARWAGRDRLALRRPPPETTLWSALAATHDPHRQF